MKTLDKLKNFNKLSAPAKASLVLMMTQMIQKGLAVITSPIYTRLLTTSEYGEVSLFFSWYEIFVIFTGLCLSKGVFNNGMLDYKDDRDSFTLSMYSLTLIATLVIGTVTTVFCTVVYNFLKLPVKLIIYMFVLLAFEAALSQWTVRNRFEYKYKATAIVTIALAVLSPLTGVICIYLFPANKVFARIIGARNIFLVGYIAVLIYLIYKAKGKVRTKYWTYALKFNLPLIPHYLSLHILNHMDRIMIASIVDNAAAGIYSAAYSGASVVKIFWQSINASLIPWTYEKCEEKDYKSLADLTKVLITGYGMICMTFMFLAPEIMRVLAPRSYHEGIYVIPSVIAGVFFSSLYYIFANVVYYYKKPKYVMIASVGSAVINVILNAIFIPLFGYLAAGYTTMGSYILQAIIDYWAMKKIVKEDIYDMRFVIAISMLVIGVGILLSFIYQFMLIRMVLFVLFILFALMYLKKNISLLKVFFSKKKGK